MIGILFKSLIRVGWFLEKAAEVLDLASDYLYRKVPNHDERFDRGEEKCDCGECLASFDFGWKAETEEESLPDGLVEAVIECDEKIVKPLIKTKHDETFKQYKAGVKKYKKLLNEEKKKQKKKSPKTKKPGKSKSKK